MEWKSRIRRASKKAFGRLSRVSLETSASLPDRSLDAYLKSISKKPSAFDVTGSPTVSVIVPAHGKVDLTLRCLSSLGTAATAVPFEVIVVDDGSSPPLEADLGRVPGLNLVRNQERSGFVAAANRGARAASGDFLLFLNNDTVVTDGWLDALWRRIESSTNIGIVGARLVFPDGTVQEAGGIVWADGSASNYGRGFHPEDPRIGYAREVDYCSGACLLVRRSLFEECDAFDRLYAPGYYEDVDLSFAARVRGARTWYEPAATVYHEEGGTAGTDPAHGMKRSQEVNRDKFRERWDRALGQQPSRERGKDVAKDRGMPKRALVVDHRMPTPERDAGSQRLVRILEDLRRLGWRSTVAPYDLEDHEEPRAGLEALGVEVLRHPFVAHLDRYLKAQEQQFDVVVLSRVGVAHRLVSIVRARCPEARILFDTVDLKSIRDQREGELTGDTALVRAARRSRKHELEVLDAADATLVTSRVERDVLLQQRPDARIELLPTWYPLVRPELPFERRSGAIFIGGFRHRPNVDGLIWFLESVFPAVRRLLPGFVLNVIGESPPPELTRYQDSQVRFHGFVHDVASYFQRSRLSIAPLRFGAGLKGKVHQSLAYGLPCVATPIAAEGLSLLPEVHAALASEPGDFAEAVFRVYSNSDLWQRLSVEGSRHVERYFSEEVARAGLARALGVA